MKVQAKQLFTMLVLLGLGFATLCWYLPRNHEPFYLFNLSFSGMMIVGYFSVLALTSPWRNIFNVSIIFATIFCLLLVPFIVAFGGNMNRMFVYHAAPVIVPALFPPLLEVLKHYLWKWGYSEYR